jgi:spore maturation protein B
MDYLMLWLKPVLDPMGIPPEILPMAITRPLSGGGSLAVLADMIKAYGMDSVFVKISAVMYGACETTFYVIAVYFGAVGIKKTRHAVPAGLIADAAGNLYGTTSPVFGSNNGTVFKLTPSGPLTTLYAFNGHGDGVDRW